jgi:hypothetical protein
MHTRPLRPCALAAVLLLLAAPALHGADAPRPRPAAVRPVAVGSAAPAVQLWSWLTGFWDAVGCSLDPNGHCAPDAGSPATAGTPTEPDLGEVGCSLDPSGCTK